jgi:sRNA-binding carbon storage regulator CsrA
MIVLSRQLNESIIIDETVEVYVVGFSRETVDLVILGLPGTHVRRISLQLRETVSILQEVSVMLIENRHGKAKLGVNAPRIASIRRGEMASQSGG